MNNVTPTGWAIVSIEDLGGVSGGKTPSKANPNLWSSRDVPWVSPKDMKKNILSDTEDRISQLAINQEGMTLYPANSVLMVTRSSILQHTFPVALAAVQLTVNQDIKVFRPSEAVVPKFFFYMLRSFGAKILLECSKDGTTVQSIDSEKLESFPLPLPPLDEQTRITAKLDELLAQVDTLKARVDGIPALLKRFRQSVLAAAVSGRLTEEWRMLDVEFGSKDKRPGWIPKSLLELGELARGKSKHRPRNDERLLGGEYPFIQTGEVANSSGRIKTAKVFYSDFGLAQSRLFPKGTLCITIAANIADTAILDIEACFPDSVVGFVANEWKCCAQFVKYLIDVNKQNLEDFAPATAQKNINLKVLSELAFPIPPLEEQIEAVRRVEQLFAFADQLEARIKAAQVRIDRLTQSVLAKAFKGDLVPQDPDDEPASVLLDRIKAQRAAAPKAKRGRRAATLD